MRVSGVPALVNFKALKSLMTRETGKGLSGEAGRRGFPLTFKARDLRPLLLRLNSAC
jgi:hypothetical protein